MSKIKIISLLCVMALLVACLGLGVYADDDKKEEEKLTATVESTILIKGDDPVPVKINTGKIVKASSSNEKVVTFDLEKGTLVPVGKGEATVTIKNDAGQTATLQIEVYNSALALGLETTLLGMGSVFAVLIIIWLILVIFGKIATAGQKKPKSKPAPEAVVPVAPAPTAAAAPAPAAVAASDDGELVAAITAAVSLCMEMPVGSFRVVSFRKTNTKQAWNKK